MHLRLRFVHESLTPDYPVRVAFKKKTTFYLLMHWEGGEWFIIMAAQKLKKSSRSTDHRTFFNQSISWDVRFLRNFDR